MLMGAWKYHLSGPYRGLSEAPTDAPEDQRRATCAAAANDACQSNPSAHWDPRVDPTKPVAQTLSVGLCSVAICKHTLPITSQASFTPCFWLPPYPALVARCKCMPVLLPC